MGASPAEVPSESLDELYRRCMEPLLERARAWFPTLRGSEEDLYQAAWSSLLGAGSVVENPEKYLEAALYSAGLKELRRRRRRPTVSLSVARFTHRAGGRGVWEQGVDALSERTEPLPEEQLESREDARLVVELLDELTPLQRRIIKLRWGYGLRRREAAALLGISEKSVKRQMEKAAPLVTRSAELVRAGKWCEAKESLAVAYSLGLLGEQRARKAREHLRRCPACRALATAMHDRLEGLASVLPLPALSATPGSQGMLARAAEHCESIRSGVTELSAGAKGHALVLFTRSPAADTAASQVAAGGGLRGGGSILAAVTACLVAGSGATYCAVEGVPDSLRDLGAIEQSNNEHAGNDGPEEATPGPPAAEPSPPISSVPQPDYAGGGTNSGKPKAPEPAADVTSEAQPPSGSNRSAEFDVASAAAKRSRPPAAPSTSGGEFGP